MSTKRNDYQETRSWNAWQKYSLGFLSQANVGNVMRQRRRFYKGDQYDPGMDENIPKPVLNICFEYVEKVRAKLSETPYAVEFTSLDETRSLNKVDKFYEYQSKKMNDSLTNSDVIKSALIDGVSCVFTMYDADTYGIRGKYRGYLKRKVVDFEDCFFANPYCSDPQDQEYLGFVQKVSVEQARSLCEVESRKSLIVPDSWNVDEDYNPTQVAFDTVTLVTRYFRDRDGEVCFELSTQYCDLFRKPHHIRPGLDDFDNGSLSDDTEDYEGIAPEKASVQTKAEEIGEDEYSDRLKVFWRYPFAWFRPYPLHGNILGDTVINQLMSIQKMVNFTNMMSMMNFQNHSFAKWVVMDDALADGEVINNDPGQVLHIKNAPGRSIGNVIQRLEPSNVSAEQLNQAYQQIQSARQVYGFDNLTAANAGGDSSGYALQQIQGQLNLVLKEPEKAFWTYIRDTAETDILFFRDYVDEAYFFTKRSAGEVSRQDSMRDMAQSVYDANGMTPPGADGNGQLPRTSDRASETVTQEDFMKDFDVCVEVTQGVSTSQISESQHYSQVFQWIATGNIDGALAKAWVNCDPAFSRKTRENLIASLDAYENSQLKMKDAEIDQYKQYIRQLQEKFTQLSQQVDYQNTQLKSFKDAAVENARQNEAVTKATLNQMKQMDTAGKTQGEVKSDNARGIEGQTFDTGTSEGALY